MMIPSRLVFTFTAVLLAQAADKPSPIGYRSPTAPVKTAHAPKKQEKTEPALEQETGIACYGAFGPDKLTAAHPSYPFGSRLRVTNVGNGRTVIVTVVDRAPAGNRIIAVSRQAAEELEMVDAGTAQVKVELLTEGSAN